MYLAHKKPPTPLGSLQGPRHLPTAGSREEVFSYERGIPAQLSEGGFEIIYQSITLSRLEYSVFCRKGTVSDMASLRVHTWVPHLQETAPPQDPAAGLSMPRVLGGSQGGGHFIMSEIPLYMTTVSGLINVSLRSSFVCTWVPRLSETAIPQDPTVGLCLGSYSGPRGSGGFL